MAKNRISTGFLWTMAALVLVAPDKVEPNSCAATAAAAPPVVLFNFGDSNSDTGGLSAGLGYYFPLPEGREFFGRPTGRLCDGRLIIDFFCESLKMNLLSPYLQALGSNFSNGANFAIAGAATLPRDHPFNLNIQLLQYLRFRSRSLELIAQGARDLIDEDGFQRAIYTFDIGQNDLSGAFNNPNRNYEEVDKLIPSFIYEIHNAIKMIYDNGGKKFWVHNTGPLGCLPQKLAVSRRDGHELDQFGCLTNMNNAAKEFNSQLSSMLDNLSSTLDNATIVYIDVFSVKYNLIANHTRYGFESPAMVCCGYGGQPYNYNQNITCGNSAATTCNDGSKYISWDGVHYSQAANAMAASMILSGNYSKPNLKLGDLIQC